MPTPLPTIAGQGTATTYAATLLRGLGIAFEHRDGPADPIPAAAWAASGAMALTGWPHRPPHPVAAPVASCAEGTLRALRALAPGALLPIDGAALLGERAAIAGGARAGTTSVGGHARLMATRDGWLAVQLARDDDREALPAWLEQPVGPDVWDEVSAALAKRRSDSLVERAAWLGLPVARATRPGDSRDPTDWLRRETLRPPGPDRRTRRPRVIDLTSLWAGPLATSLLASMGAEVIKVESRQRPDGARQGPAPFFDLLNARKRCVALDLRANPDRGRLLALIRSADLVMESARPRALAQLGIDAREEVRRRPGLSWLRITGYGPDEPPPGRVAFGDDAAVAGGLAWAAAADAGVPVFCGDAIADPLTGLHAALAAHATWCRGGGELLDLALAGVTHHVARFESESRGDAVATPVAAPRARAVSERAAPLGRDDREILASLAPPC